MQRKKIIIIGGGSAGLKAADTLAPYFDIAVYDKAKTVGRKFLVAGKGGFNLTNSAQGAELVGHYHAPAFITDCLLAYDTAAVRTWLDELRIPTYVGSSGRVFPRQGIKPYEVLKAVKNRLIRRGVQFHTGHRCVDFNNGLVNLESGDQTVEEPADYIIFALGGASWPVTGSDGNWAEMFQKRGIGLNPFQASNCGVNIEWPENLAAAHNGKPLKNIRISIGEAQRMGEALITRYGLEGNALYPLVPYIRQALDVRPHPLIYLDFKPNNSIEQLEAKLPSGVLNTREYAELFNIDAAEMAVIKAFTPKEQFLDSRDFVRAIKHLPLPVHSLRPIQEAISTTGGVRADEMNPDFSLRRFPDVFVVGEMLDWDAPTGGFLLQACFSMAQCAANAILKRENIGNG